MGFSADFFSEFLVSPTLTTTTDGLDDCLWWYDNIVTLCNAIDEKSLNFLKCMYRIHIMHYTLDSLVVQSKMYFFTFILF